MDRSTAPDARTAPHERPDMAAATVRSGQFWIPGDVKQVGITVQSGPMYVYWEAPEVVTRRYPVIFVHGGGAQGTDWLGTVDGRTGWARRFVEAGFAVYVIDRPGHGRSAFHPDVIGAMGPQFGYEPAAGLFIESATDEPHTAWPWGSAPGDPEMDQLIASVGPLPADLGLSQELDADRLATLLDLTGPAVLVTHSAGGPSGWLTATLRPGLVKAIAAIEPMGPAFAEFPGLGTLTWGLTTAPIAYDAAYETSDAVVAAPAAERTIAALAGLRVAVFTGGSSPFSSVAPEVVAFLGHAGANAERVHLPDLGIHGNGHGLMLEQNSDDTVRPVIDWLAAQP
ncbi:alpha/beta fold hydrolase [Herbiconiux sp.]|uniref:alpha/beta fold hydrolase n=1 Tax=Herbiconiux sp. TaxID=1871186 RepID=UPI0025BD5A63|nr:alpha/beta fold hydrolase [Herbiconiux sp.]